LYSLTGAGRAAGVVLTGAVAVGLLVLLVEDGAIRCDEHPASASANKQRGKTRIDIPLP
jgi:hypothetical protein